MAAAERLAAAEELANDSELSAVDQLDELSGTQELAITDPIEDAMTEFGLDGSIEQPAQGLGDSLLEDAAASAGISSDSATTEPNDPVEPTQSMAKTTPADEAETKTEAIAALSTAPLSSGPLSTAPLKTAPLSPPPARTAKAKTVATSSTPQKLRRSSSYGGWMWALIPILGLPFIGWLALRKKKRLAQERRFAEAALHRVNTKKSSPSVAKTASPVAKTAAPAATVKPAVPKPATAPTASTMPTRAETAPAKVATPPTALPTTPQAAVPQEPKTQSPFTITPSNDTAGAGILSMDDLKGVELTGVDFAGKASADAGSESAEATASSGSSKARVELGTDFIESASRDNLTSIDGIDDATQHALYKAGYLSFKDLAKANERELQLALSKHSHQFSSADFSNWSAEAAVVNLGDGQPVAPLTPAVREATPTAPISRGDDLTKIRGIGPATAELLMTAGITTFSAIRQAGTPRLQEILDSGGEKFAVVDPAMWCRQAEFAMVSLKPREEAATVLLNTEPESNSIQSPAAQLAAASTASQDDLTKIAGIDSETQQVLRKVGIQQFEQIAGMTADQLSEVLATQESKFQSLEPSSWPVQARALLTRLSEESDVLAQVNSIIDIAKSSAANATATSASSAADAAKTTFK